MPAPITTSKIDTIVALIEKGHDAVVQQLIDGGDLEKVTSDEVQAIMFALVERNQKTDASLRPAPDSRPEIFFRSGIEGLPVLSWACEDIAVNPQYFVEDALQFVNVTDSGLRQLPTMLGNLDGVINHDDYIELLSGDCIWEILDSSGSESASISIIADCTTTLDVTDDCVELFNVRLEVFCPSGTLNPVVRGLRLRAAKGGVRLIGLSDHDGVWG